MRKVFSYALGVVLVTALAGPAHAADDVVMKAMHDELDRSMQMLRLEQLEKPYFISYHVQEKTVLDTSATFGGLLAGGVSRVRFLVVQVRVGDYQRDNSNFMTAPPKENGLEENIILPIDDDYKELRRQIWLATDSAYKSALEILSRKRAALENRQMREQLPDFSKEQPVTDLHAFSPVKMDLPAAESLVKNLSAVFREAPEIYTSSASLTLTNNRNWYVNSEGSATTYEDSSASLVAMAQTQALDGTMLPDWVMVTARCMDALPAEADLAKEVHGMADRLTRVRHATLVDRYTGPVLFEGPSGAEAFSQIMAPKLIAMRVPASDDPQAEAYAAQNVSKFQERLGSRILPRSMTVVDDPTQSAYQGAPLLGNHSVDEEGVRARAITLIDQGYLKTLLNTRDPVDSIAQSSGSFRTFGAQPSNLILNTTDGVGEPELKDQFISMIKARNGDFGIEVRKVGREIYKVTPDGHEELIRVGLFDGLDDGAFKDLAAVSREQYVFSIPFAAYGGRLYPGQAGAPLASFVAPSLLFEELSLKPPIGQLPRLPLSQHPYFEK
jgi:hypothetical protein